MHKVDGPEPSADRGPATGVTPVADGDSEEPVEPGSVRISDLGEVEVYDGSRWVVYDDLLSDDPGSDMRGEFR
jgi:hypothetical protein